MRLDAKKIKKLCRLRGLKLKQLLTNADVSPTAFYSLVRKDSVLPRSVNAIAQALDLPPTELLEDDKFAIRAMRKIQIEAEQILLKYPEADRDNIVHTLILLDEEPVERLNRSLQRAQKFKLHKSKVSQ